MKEIKEICGGSILKGFAGRVCSSANLDKPAKQKPVNGIIRAYTANLLDFTPGNWLIIGNNGKNFKDGAGKPSANPGSKKLFEKFTKLRSGQKTVASGYTVNLKSPSSFSILGVKPLNNGMKFS